MKPTSQSIIVVFDFDGTMTYGSTTMAFIRYLAKKNKTYHKFIPLFPALLNYSLGLISIDQLNKKIAQLFFKGHSRDYLMKEGALFAQTQLPLLLRPKALEKLNWHIQHQHFCIVATGAYNVYVDAWAKAVGFSAVLSTAIEFNKDQYATGNMQGTTCHGNEKIRCIKTLIDQDYIDYAYGDSKGDAELLAFAKHKFYRHF